MADLPALRKLLSAARSRTDASQFPELQQVLARRDNRGRRHQNNGLTQAHMDVLLSRPPRTYERLERGANVPRSLLEDVARILRLTEAEWRAAWRFAYTEDPPRPLTQTAGLTLPGTWQEALDNISSIAWVTNRDGHLLAHNAAFSQSFDHGKAPSHPLRWALTSPEALQRLLHWHTTWAPLLLARLRAALALHEDSTPLTHLRDEVLSNADTAKLFETHSATAIAAPSRTPLPYRHPTKGAGWLTMSTASPEDSPGARLTIATFRPGTTAPIHKPLLTGQS